MTETQDGRALQDKQADMESALPRRLFTVKDAENYLDCSRWTLQRWVSKGLLRQVKIGRTIKFDLTELDRFIEEQTE